MNLLIVSSNDRKNRSQGLRLACCQALKYVHSPKPEHYLVCTCT